MRIDSLSTWNKSPSVTTAGKAFFYTNRDDNGLMLTIVWNRIEQMWSFQVDHTHVSFHKTPKEAAKGILL